MFGIGGGAGPRRGRRAGRPGSASTGSSGSRSSSARRRAGPRGATCPSRRCACRRASTGAARRCWPRAGSLLLGVCEGNAWGWTRPACSGCSPARSCSASLRGLRAADEDPLVDLALMRRRPVWTANLAASRSASRCSAPSSSSRARAAARRGRLRLRRKSSPSSGLSCCPRASSCSGGPALAAGSAPARVAAAARAGDGGGRGGVLLARLRARPKLGDLRRRDAARAWASAWPSPRSPTSSWRPCRRTRPAWRPAINTIARSVGGAVGAQVAAALVTAGTVTAAARYPAESGYTAAFLMSGVGARSSPCSATLAVPGRAAPRPLARGPVRRRASGPRRRPR